MALRDRLTLPEFISWALYGQPGHSVVRSWVAAPETDPVPTQYDVEELRSKVVWRE